MKGKQGKAWESLGYLCKLCFQVLSSETPGRNLSLVKVHLNNMAESVAEVARVLETYRGREKLMRLLQYASYLASGGLQKLSYESSAGKFRIWAEAISECRTFLRLFDDAAMLSYARDYGTGKEVGNNSTT